MTSLGRLALVTPLYPPAVGGVERMVEATALELHERGYQVDVITTAPWSDQPYRELRDGIRIRRFPTIGGDSVYFVSPRLSTWLARSASAYSLIHAYSYHTPLALAAAFACKLADRPFVVTPVYHGSGHTAVRNALHTPYRVFGHWMLRQARAIGCISGAERDLIASHVGSDLPLRLTIPGIEVEEIRAAVPMRTPAGRRLLVSAGRLVDYKHVDRVIRALESAPPDLDLVILGDGPSREVLEHLAASSPVHERIRLLGQVSRNDLLRWLRAADVFVSLSEHEAFGLSVLEAATAGAAVVASDLPSHQEIARFTGGERFRFLKSSAASSAIAAAISSAMRAGRVERTAGWPIPTWREHVDAVLGMYAVDGSSPVETRSEQAA